MCNLVVGSSWDSLDYGLDLWCGSAVVVGANLFTYSILVLLFSTTGLTPSSPLTRIQATSPHIKATAPHHTSNTMFVLGHLLRECNGRKKN